MNHQIEAWDALLRQNQAVLLRTLYSIIGSLILVM